VSTAFPCRCLCDLLAYRVYADDFSSAELRELTDKAAHVDTSGAESNSNSQEQCVQCEEEKNKSLFKKEFKKKSFMKKLFRRKS
jgi:hypothetical protein